MRKSPTVRPTTMVAKFVGMGVALVTTVSAGGTIAATSPSPSPSSALATASEDWDAIVAAAEEEGSLTVYSSQVLPVLEELEPAFEEATGLDLEVVRGLPQDLFPKLEAERQTDRGIADIYVIADKQLVANDGAAGHFIAPVGPNFVDSAYDSAAYLEPEGWFLVSSTLFGYGWNTELVPDGLTGYEDLLDPELEGQVGVIEASNQALTDFYLYLEETQGAEFVEALAAQEPRIYPGGTAIQEALTSGEIAASVYAGAAMDGGMEAGAPIDWAIPDDPWGARYYSGVLDTAPHPNAAQVFANYLISPEGQEIVARGTASVLPDIESARRSVEGMRDQDIELLTPEFVAEYTEQWRELSSSKALLSTWVELGRC